MKFQAVMSAGGALDGARAVARAGELVAVARGGKPNQHSAGAQLTSRQREVLRLIAAGGSNKEIAYKLRISVKTVEFHKTNLMARLGLRTTADLVKYALKHGLTEI